MISGRPAMGQPRAAFFRRQGRFPRRRPFDVFLLREAAVQGLEVLALDEIPNRTGFVFFGQEFVQREGQAFHLPPVRPPHPWHAHERLFRHKFYRNRVFRQVRGRIRGRQFQLLYDRFGIHPLFLAHPAYLVQTYFHKIQALGRFFHRL
jgi:hypothetical protein